MANYVYITEYVYNKALDCALFTVSFGDVQSSCSCASSSTTSAQARSHAQHWQGVRCNVVDLQSSLRALGPRRTAEALVSCDAPFTGSTALSAKRAWDYVARA